MDYFIAALNGGYIYADDRTTDAAAMVAAVTDNRINYLVASPVQLSAMLDASADRSWLERLACLGSAGEIFPDELYKRLRKYRIRPIFNFYSPVESALYATLASVKSLPVNLGVPAPDKRVYVLDGERLCGVGMPGEICVAGAFVARGYLNRTEQGSFTQDPFVGGRMFRTGDCGRWLPDGSLDFLSRTIVSPLPGVFAKAAFEPRPDMTRQLSVYHEELTRGGVVAIIGVSPPQRLAWDTAEPAGLHEVMMDAAYDRERLCRAWIGLLTEFPVLSSGMAARRPLTEFDSPMEMRLFSPIGIKRIPFADFSGAANPAAELVSFRNKLMDFNPSGQYDGTSPGCYPVAVKLGASQFALEIMASRLLFDGTGGEALDLRLRTLYAGTQPNEPKYYSDYIAALRRGPLFKTEAELIDGTRLEMFAEAVRNREQKLGTKSLTHITYERQASGGNEELFQLAGKLLSGAMGFTWGNTEVPLLLAYSARQTASYDFTGYIGNFMDVIPILAEPVPNMAAAVTKARSRAFEYSVNFAAIMYDGGQRFPIASGVLRPSILKNRGSVQKLRICLSSDMAEAPGIDESQLTVSRHDGRLRLSNLECPEGSEDEFRKYLDYLN
jgi:hypothetical protein